MLTQLHIQKEAFRAYLLRFFARTVLVAYTLLIIKPVMPVMMDKVAHTFWAEVHFRTIHVHNGVEHVHYEVKKMNEQDQQGNSTGNSGKQQTQTETVAHIIAAQEEIVFSQQQDIERSFGSYRCNVLGKGSIVDYPPPRA